MKDDRVYASVPQQARPGRFVFNLPPWFDEALCAQTDPEGFFPEHGRSNRSAKAICAQCPVQAKCLAYALDNNEAHGVWGGCDGKERARMRRERRRGTAA